jgi:hypothetical protein
MIGREIANKVQKWCVTAITKRSFPDPAATRRTLRGAADRRVGSGASFVRVAASTQENLVPQSVIQDGAALAPSSSRFPAVRPIRDQGHGGSGVPKTW